MVLVCQGDGTHELHLILHLIHWVAWVPCALCQCWQPWPLLSHFGLDYGPFPAYINHLLELLVMVHQVRAKASSRAFQMFNTCLVSLGKGFAKHNSMALGGCEEPFFATGGWHHPLGTCSLGYVKFQLLVSKCFISCKFKCHCPTQLVQVCTCCHYGTTFSVTGEWVHPCPTTIKWVDHEEIWWKYLLVGKLGLQQNLLNLPPFLHNSILVFQDCFNSLNHIGWQHGHSIQTPSYILRKLLQGEEVHVTIWPKGFEWKTSIQDTANHVNSIWAKRLDFGLCWQTCSWFFSQQAWSSYIVTCSNKCIATRLDLTHAILQKQHECGRPKAWFQPKDPCMVQPHSSWTKAATIFFTHNVFYAQGAWNCKASCPQYGAPNSLCKRLTVSHLNSSKQFHSKALHLTWHLNCLTGWGEQNWATSETLLYMVLKQPKVNKWLTLLSHQSIHPLA